MTQKKQETADMQQYTDIMAILDYGTADMFINVYMAAHKCSQFEAQNGFVIEKFNFARMIQEDEELQGCTRLSMCSIFVNVIAAGLSFSEEKKLVYLKTRNHNIKTKTGNTTEKRLEYEPQADGHIYLCMLAGSVQMVSTPAIVYDTDDFEAVYEPNGSKWYKFKRNPRTDKSRILAGFCWITDRFGNRHAFDMYIEQMMRLEGFSRENNKKTSKPNKLYTSGINGQVDEEFFATKIKKFAVADWPKASVIGNAPMAMENVQSKFSGMEAERWQYPGGTTAAPLQQPELQRTWNPPVLPNAAQPVQPLIRPVQMPEPAKAAKGQSATVSNDPFDGPGKGNDLYDNTF